MSQTLKERFLTRAIDACDLLEMELQDLAGAVSLLQQTTQGANGSLMPKVNELQEAYITLRAAIEAQAKGSPTLEDVMAEVGDPFPADDFTNKWSRMMKPRS